MKNADRRDRLFAKYSKNFKLVCDWQKWKVGYKNNGSIDPVEDDYYPCPLCLNIFTKSALDQSLTNPLTLEDAPPKALGGKPIVLTCKKCNNQSGEDLDNHLKIGSDLAAFNKKGGEISSRLKLEDSRPFHAKFAFNKEKNRVNFTYNPKNEYALKQVKELMENWDGAKMNVTWQGPNPKKHSIGLLRTAYLIAFKQLGYSYVYTDGAKIVRSQISKPLEQNILKPFILSNKSIHDHEGVHFVNKPTSLNSIFVVFRLKQKSIIEYFGVFLPGPKAPHIQSYKSFKDSNKINFHFTNLDQYDFLNRVNQYYAMWNALGHKT